MCGLFGVIRNQTCNPTRATIMCAALGHLAEERGKDSAGLAFATSETQELTRRPVTNRRDVTAGGWRIIKGPGRFREVWKRDYIGALNEAPAVLGHTRWMTQGAAKLTNSSPLQVGQLIGTHNGDVDALPLRKTFGLPRATGDTDTEVLFQALDQAGGVILPTLDVLETVVGRAALAWTDRRWPQLVMLARTAVSPLSVAVDTNGNLYWASNPGWFRKAAKTADVTLTEILMVPEGTMIMVDYSTGTPVMVDDRSFTATARAKDDRLAQVVAYRGFSIEDQMADEAVCSHRTLREPQLSRSVAPTLWLSPSGK
ncbi:glutamine amidotransferase class-II (plasmid) [Streptomyces alboflavus]|uniref:glutamine--fructose-6-phosphate transaminase (isomerizing) n=2 Tax=Streptomyces alboflavus TaxID=67267 RepID=A0A291W494_9ACTN|nr:glutamine amidotransferase class-II [Streptomyces alboflavus]